MHAMFVLAAVYISTLHRRRWNEHGGMDGLMMDVLVVCTRYHTARSDSEYEYYDQNYDHLFVIRQERLGKIRNV